MSKTSDTNLSDKTVSIPKEKEKVKPSRTSLVLTFVGLQVALFLSVLDNTIISTALPKIGSDFDATSTASWVATAYMLTFDAFQPLFSKLSDIYGRKVILLSGIVLFLLGSVICGAAHTIAMLIGGRAVAGIGGAGITAMVFIVIADIVPLEKRAAYQGLINAVFAVSSVLGPLIGGSFTDYVTWRWNFYINLPIGAVALAMITFFLRLPTPHGNFREKLKRIDYFGTVIVLVFATLFLLALNFGGQLFPWRSAAVIVPLVLSGLLVGLLAWVEVHVAKEPLMPPRLFKNRSVVSILLVNWFFGMAFISAIYFLPVYFQVVRQDSAMWSGIRLVPMQLVLCVISMMVGISITKTGIYRPFIWFGMTLATLWIGLTSLYDQNTPFAQVYGITIVGSAGLGTLFVPTLMGLQAAVEVRDIAVVTGLGNFTRILGGALGVAISSAVLNSHLHQVLFQLIPEDQVLLVFQSSEYVNKGLPEQFRPFVVEAYVQGLRRVWFVLVGLCGAGLIVSFFVKHHPLRLPKKNANDGHAGDPEKNTQENKEDELIDISEKELEERKEKA